MSTQQRATASVAMVNSVPEGLSARAPKVGGLLTHPVTMAHLHRPGARLQLAARRSAGCWDGDRSATGLGAGPDTDRGDDGAASEGGSEGWPVAGSGRGRRRNRPTASCTAPPAIEG